MINCILLFAYAIFPPLLPKTLSEQICDPPIESLCCRALLSVRTHPYACWHSPTWLCAFICVHQPHTPTHTRVLEIHKHGAVYIFPIPSCGYSSPRLVPFLWRCYASCVRLMLIWAERYFKSIIFFSAAIQFVWLLRLAVLVRAKDEPCLPAYACIMSCTDINLLWSHSPKLPLLGFISFHCQVFLYTQTHTHTQTGSESWRRGWIGSEDSIVAAAPTVQRAG